MRISQIRHPDYCFEDYLKWRLTYEGGRLFIDRYLRKFSKRETEDDFKDRRHLSYSPSFGKAAVNKFKNTLYSRMSEIKRLEGPPSYKLAIAGQNGGVDLYGSSMDTFIGQDITKELMTMKRVGVFVDKPEYDGELLARNLGVSPYLYYYRVEDILSWNWAYMGGEYVYKNVLLRDCNFDYDPKTGLVIGQVERYRHMWLGVDGKVHMQFYVPSEDDKAEEDILSGPEIVLELTRLPFVLGELSESLLQDAADYQIGLLNLASADMNYVYKANFPFYTEQFDSAAQSIYTRTVRPPTAASNQNSNDPAQGTAAEAQISAPDQEVRVGAMGGRRYPKGTDRPEFIAPPTEPLMASMAKQDRMKSEIYELIDLAVSQVQPMHASAESKQMDNQGVETGLAYIGLELQYMEREIAKIWGMYENKPPATINYPRKYTLKSDADRIDEATALDKIKSSMPSRKAAKEVGKQIAEVMLVDKIPDETLDAIKNEIDAAEYISSDPTLIQIASELGMVDATTGSNALGFNGDKVVPLAQKEHAARLAEIAASQASGAARGVADKSPVNNQESKTEKQKAANDGAVN